MKKYSCFVLTVFMLGFISLSQAMPKRKAPEDVFEGYDRQVKAARQDEIVIEASQVKSIGGEAKWWPTTEVAVMEGTKNVHFSASKNNKWVLVLNKNIHSDSYSLVFYDSTKKEGDYHVSVSSYPIEVSTIKTSQDNDGDDVVTDLMSLSENNNYLFLQLANKEALLYIIEHSDDQKVITRLGCIELPPGVRVMHVTASLDGQGWYMARSDGIVQSVTVNGAKGVQAQSEIQYPWQYQSQTKKMVQTIHRISDGKILVNFGDSLEILDSRGKFLHRITPLYPEPIDFVAVSQDLQVAYTVQNRHADDHTGQLENLFSTGTSESGNSDLQGGLVISAWRLPESSSEVDMSNIQCIGQRILPHNVYLDKHITISAITSKSDWSKLYIGLKDGFLGSTTIDQKLTDPVTNIHRYDEGDTRWKFGHPNHNDPNVRCAISSIEWWDSKKLLVHYIDGNGKFGITDPETKYERSAWVGDTSRAKKRVKRDSLGMCMNRETCRLLQIFESKVVVYIDEFY